jgi:hypothetical protein
MTLLARNEHEFMMVPMVRSVSVFFFRREFVVWIQTVFYLVRLAGIWLQSS